MAATSRIGHHHSFIHAPPFDSYFSDFIHVNSFTHNLFFVVANKKKLSRSIGLLKQFSATSDKMSTNKNNRNICVQKNGRKQYRCRRWYSSNGSTNKNETQNRKQFFFVGIKRQRESERANVQKNISANYDISTPKNNIKKKHFQEKSLRIPHTLTHTHNP